MLVFVNVLEVDAEKGIGEVAGDCRIRKVEVDRKDGKQAEQDIEAQCTEASVRIQRPDNAILVLYACEKRVLAEKVHVGCFFLPGQKNHNVVARPGSRVNLGSSKIM